MGSLLPHLPLPSLWPVLDPVAPFHDVPDVCGFGGRCEYTSGYIICDRLSINHPFTVFCRKWDFYTNRKLIFR